MNSLVSPEAQYEDLRRRWFDLKNRENSLDMWERDLRFREDTLHMTPLKVVRKKKKQRKEKDYASMAVQPDEN